MQFEEESPKQYVDIARAPDKEMRADCPVPPGCGQDGRLLRYPPRPYRHMAFVGCLASGPSWPQRITRLVMKQVLSPVTRPVSPMPGRTAHRRAPRSAARACRGTASCDRPPNAL